jgi:NAD(P)-dependent dehydrogenase (short-subunit alcohol dehydrogenase family)
MRLPHQPFRDHGQLFRARCDRHRTDHGDGHTGSIQSNRDRTELVALRRLGTVEDCAKVVEFLATDLSDYVTGAVIPIDGGLARG